MSKFLYINHHNFITSRATEMLCTLWNEHYQSFHLVHIEILMAVYCTQKTKKMYILFTVETSAHMVFYGVHLSIKVL